MYLKHFGQDLVSKKNVVGILAHVWPQGPLSIRVKSVHFDLPAFGNRTSQGNELVLREWLKWPLELLNESFYKKNWGWCTSQHQSVQKDRACPSHTPANYLVASADHYCPMWMSWMSWSTPFCHPELKPFTSAFWAMRRDAFWLWTATKSTTEKLKQSQTSKVKIILQSYIKDKAVFSSTLFLGASQVETGLGR